ncbi:glycosyltransferase family 2 protein [Francisella sp. SYW-2]|uniref:glycosyltransferase family 2 protein n=1 Tax=Francisella sp. SYW-2 TaxID=2610886 RepID=UPI00168D071D|nr:glycosyltransferase family 2 protein [Francisella sp. SYW-2]
MNDIMVSVVMSVYNAEKYLFQSVESILNQSFKNFEFIIIDDGSTDNSLSIIKKFQKADNRIIVVSRENKGLVYSLNEGISLARGKYIARMDADDVCLKSRLEKQVLFLEKNKDIIACGTWIRIFCDSYTKILKFPSDNMSCISRLIFGVPIAHPSAMINKLFLDKLKKSDGFIYDEGMEYIEDYNLWVRLSRYGRYSNIEEVLVNYRDTPNSITDIGEKDICDRYFKSIKIASQFATRYKLLLFRNDYDKEVYFNLALNERIKSSKISQKEYLNYIDYLNMSILDSNDISVELKKSFRKILLKKYMWVILIKKQKYKAFLRKNFYSALGYWFNKQLNNL